MLHLQNIKSAVMIAPVSVGTSAVTGYVDTHGSDEILIDVIGATDAAADVFTSLKLQDGATTSAFTDLTGAVGGTSAGQFTIAAPNTSTPDIIRIRLNRVKTPALRRYVNVSLALTTARILTVVAHMGRMAETPDTAAEAGVTQIVDV
jgi:hypothetical protein